MLEAGACCLIVTVYSLEKDGQEIGDIILSTGNNRKKSRNIGARHDIVLCVAFPFIILPLEGVKSSWEGGLRVVGKGSGSRRNGLSTRRNMISKP